MSGEGDDIRVTLEGIERQIRWYRLHRASIHMKLAELERERERLLRHAEEEEREDS